MDIFDYIDCEDCNSYTHTPARLTADPYYSEPTNDECADGDFGVKHPCERMINRIEEGIRDGDFDDVSMLTTFRDLQHGSLNTRDFLETDQKDKENPQWYQEFDFSTAPFWWMPLDYESPENEPHPFNTVEEVYDEFFN